MSDQHLENTYGASKLKNFLEFSFVLIRSMWQRAGAVRLFVEHVTLLNECDGDEVNSESVVTLWKVFPIQVTQLSIKKNNKLKQPDCTCVSVCISLKTWFHKRQKRHCTKTKFSLLFYNIQFLFINCN